MFGTVSTKLNNIKNSYQEHGGGIKGAVAGTMTAIKEYYKTGYDAINSLTGGKLGQVVESVKTKLSPILNSVKEKLSGIKDVFGSAFSKAFEFVRNSYNEGDLKQIMYKCISTLNGIKKKISCRRKVIVNR